jgi:hypothetical protein
LAIIALRDDAGGDRVLGVFGALILASWAAFTKEMVVRLAAWGFAMALVAALSPERPLVFSIGLLGAALALASAGRAIATMPSLGGLATPRPRSRMAQLVVPAGFALPMVLWAIVTVTRAQPPWPAFATPLVFGVLELAMMWSLLRRELWSRALDLGMPERLNACTGSVLLAAAAASLLSVTRGAPAASAAISLAAASGLACALLAVRGDAARIARASRRAIVALATGTTILLFGELWLVDRPRSAADLFLVMVAVAIVFGMMATELAKPLRPAHGAWLDAMETATSERLRAGAEEAIRTTLHRLREPAGQHAPSPELHLVHPTRCIRIDSAGYARESDSAIPAELLLVATKEPEAVLRTDVVASLEVRRPDLRGLLAWLVDRDALASVVVTLEGEPEAVLVIPRGGRDAPFALEEVRALKALADGLAGACHSRAALARSTDRERSAHQRAEGAEGSLERLEHRTVLDAEREARMTTRLARPATVGLYSSASRHAYELLESRAKMSAPFVAIGRSGVDPVPYIARAHQAGVRANAPLVLVDGTQHREHDLARWKDKNTSPLALAEHGLLVLLDGAVLPVEVQRLVAAAHAEKRTPWEGSLDVVLGLTSALRDCGGDDSALRQALDPMLAARLGDALESPVRLPSIRDRGEDIRALLTDRLAREGLRVHGRPVGIDDAAFALLVDHPFDGEDAELASIATRLVELCQSDLVRAADVCKLQLSLSQGAETIPQVPKIRGV